MFLFVILQILFSLIGTESMECLVPRELNLDDLKSNFVFGDGLYQKFHCDRDKEVCCKKGCCLKDGDPDFMWILYVVFAVIGGYTVYACVQNIRKTGQCCNFTRHPESQLENGPTLTSAEILDFGAVTSQDGGAPFRTPPAPEIHPSAPPLTEGNSRDEKNVGSITPPPSYEDAIAAPLMDQGHEVTSPSDDKH